MDILFRIEYLCALFVGDGVKLRYRQIIRCHVGMESNTGENFYSKCETSRTSVECVQLNARQPENVSDRMSKS
jgi:hypothetical protein